jgi:hypothetical protein
MLYPVKGRCRTVQKSDGPKLEQEESMFDLIKNKKTWKNKKSVEEIDYSILLTRVFGKPITTDQAFMYFFRRYGLPNELHDDYKELCVYSFRTRDRNIIVRWRLMTGDYHHGLCAFVKRNDYIDYAWRPLWEWHKKIQEKAESEGLVYFGGHGLLSVYKKRGEKTVFAGNAIQKAAINNFCKDYSNNDEEAWSKIDERMMENDTKIKDKYRGIFPYLSMDSQYGKSWACQFNNQVEAGKEQHEWIMSLPEKHFLRRVYFTVMELFEDWKRKTYIRDVYFDLTCEEDPNANGKTTGYTDYSIALKGEEA